jgi:hypothetical protein
VHPDRPTPSPARRLAVRGLRLAVVLATAAGGALALVGSALTLLFELQGFGSRDGEPDGPVLVGAVVGIVASIAVPLAAWRFLYPRAAPVWALVSLPLLGLVLALLGIGLGR